MVVVASSAGSCASYSLTRLRTAPAPLIDGAHVILLLAQSRSRRLTPGKMLASRSRRGRLDMKIHIDGMHHCEPQQEIDIHDAGMLHSGVIFEQYDHRNVWRQWMVDESEGIRKQFTSRLLLPEEGRPRPKCGRLADVQYTITISRTCANSLWYCSISAGSTSTSAGLRAGAATNSREGLLQTVVSTFKTDAALRDTHPTSFLASHRNGFSKL